MCIFHRNQSISSSISLSTSENDSKTKILDRLTRFKLLAHHPSCKFYHNHLIYLLGYPFCLGCFGMTIGIIAGVVVLFFIGHRYPSDIVFSMGFILYFPSILQMKLQNYYFKLFARFLLGISVILCIYSIFFIASISWTQLLQSLLYLLVFIVVYKLTQFIRTNNLDNPCAQCPEGIFPFCSWKQGEIRELLALHEGGTHIIPQDMYKFLKTISSAELSSGMNSISNVELIDISCLHENGQ